MRESELSRALAASVACCQTSAHWKNHLINQIVTEEKLKKRTKVSVGIVLAIVLVLLSMVALAVSILNRSYYEKVAEMDANGALNRWELRDKITFVSVMKENNFEIDQAEYEMMMDASLPDNQREAAADRIVNHTYGELIRAQLGYYITEEEDSLGLAPDPVIVFEERYLAEHPEAQIKVVLSVAGEPVAIPMQKGERTESLVAEINRILEEARQNGKLVELSSKYFGRDLTKEE